MRNASEEKAVMSACEPVLVPSRRFTAQWNQNDLFLVMQQFSGRAKNEEKVSNPSLAVPSSPPCPPPQYYSTFKDEFLRLYYL